MTQSPGARNSTGKRARRANSDASAMPAGRRNEARWVEILHAARDVILEKGYEAMTLDDVASRVGLLKGSLYYYIRDKEDLLCQTLVRSNAEYLEELHKDPGVAEGDAVSRMSCFIDHEVTWLDRNPWWPTVLGGHHVLTSDRLAEIWAIRQDLHGVLLDILTQGMAEGVFDQTKNPSIAAYALMALLTTTGRWYPVADRHSSTEIAAWYKAFVLKGLMTSEPPKNTRIARRR
jgi:AcrR family transcriptional regulator